jgi:predicted site-specific integrase-resolvase
MAGMFYGYARVSTDAQDLTSQLAQLKAAGCVHVLREKVSRATSDRPQLRKLMAAVSDGDVVIIPRRRPPIARHDRPARYRPRPAIGSVGLRSIAEPVVDTS